MLEILVVATLVALLRIAIPGRRGWVGRGLDVRLGEIREMHEGGGR